MIQCISFNLNKLKDDCPILITPAHATCTSAKCATKMLHATHACACANSKATSITPLDSFKVLVCVPP